MQGSRQRGEAPEATTAGQLVTMGLRIGLGRSERTVRRGLDYGAGRPGR